MLTISKTLLFVGLFGSTATAKLGEPTVHLDLELTIDGERELFPLLPGVKCPTGHTCFTHNSLKHSTLNRSGRDTPIVSSLKDNMKTPLAMTMNWHELNNEFTVMTDSSDKCTRRAAMAKAAGLIAGGSAAAMSASKANAAETVEVKMGTDSGLLAFLPNKISICKGDSVTWINNKAGPHNVVFDEDAIPAGVDQEAISMSEQLGEEGETFTMKFDVAGSYEYYCEPHRGAGMMAKMTVA